MSFRSHSRTAQPIVPRRRRSLSNSRVPSSGSNSNSSTIGSSLYYNGNPTSSAYSSSTSRPLSGGYYSTPSSSSIYYQNPYSSPSAINLYGSRENLYYGGNNNSSINNGSSHLHHHSPRNGYYQNGNNNNNNNDKNNFINKKLKYSNNNRTSKKITSNQNKICNNSFLPMKHLKNSIGSYDALRYGDSGINGSCNGMSPGGGYSMRNYYNSDRYMSPYSSYDNGVTTAGLSLSMAPVKSYSPLASHKNSSISSSPYILAPSSSNSSTKHDYMSSYSTPSLNNMISSSSTGSGGGINSNRHSNLLRTKSLSTSNTNVNSISSYPLSSSKISVGTNTQTSSIGRSQSLREQERKSRSRSRKRSVAARSLSASSEKSEGYESGGERVSRSRLGSTSSLAENERHAQNDKKDSSENGEVIDYKALWEAVKLENDKLKQQLKKKDDELVSTKATVEKFTNVTSKNSLSELEKRERRAMERKLSEMEEELKHLDILKTENQRLKEENGALIRVISKLSK